jgi:hypothetical protein
MYRRTNWEVLSGIGTCNRVFGARLETGMFVPVECLRVRSAMRCVAV